MATPDPVGDPAGYQRYLLSLLGDDDPVAVQSSTIEAWRDLVAEAADALGVRPERGEWSVLECLGHATDAEIVYAGRYRWILAHDEPPLIGYDQDLWVERLRHGTDDPGELFAVFGVLRRANLGLWERMSEAERARFGIHAERGPESFDLSFRLIAGHDRLHLDQARRALAAVSGA